MQYTLPFPPDIRMPRARPFATEKPWPSGPVELSTRSGRKAREGWPWSLDPSLLKLASSGRGMRPIRAMAEYCAAQM
jgi:hypothetical protein